eukprot:GHRQ01019184.1.p2 GENE.GHRQ01019184.1~~GHRQ01019184.1.p2  ORF type:complete len:118 (-),score=12.47 GHRQ01019184.1:771-1124(-)
MLCICCPLGGSCSFASSTMLDLLQLLAAEWYAVFGYRPQLMLLHSALAAVQAAAPYASHPCPDRSACPTSAPSCSTKEAVQNQHAGRQLSRCQAEKIEQCQISHSTEAGTRAAPVKL